MNKFGCQTTECDEHQKELKNIFIANRAIYHNKCVSRSNDQKLQRVKKRSLKAEKVYSEPGLDETSQSKRKKRNDSDSSFCLGELKCLFCMQVDISENLCAAGTMHAKSKKVDSDHVLQFTETLKTKALKLNQTHVLAALLTGDVTSNEVYYHKMCLIAFNNRYNSALQREMAEPVDDADVQFQKEIYFRRVIHYVNEQCKICVFAFEVHELEVMYQELLESDGILYSSHVSRFTARLQEALPEFQRQKVGQKIMLCCSGDIDNIMKNQIKEFNQSSLVKSLLKVVVPIRQHMSEVSNSFQGRFPPNCQQSSSPLTLLSLCSLLIDGADPRQKGVSQAALTVSQLIMYAFANRRHLKKRETPVPVYVGLKLRTLRAKTLIQKLFFLGISISYDRCLDICSTIAVSLLEKYDRAGVFVGNSRLNLFTIVAKDNIDVNAKSTKIALHFHGISMTIMQFSSDNNCGLLQEPLYDLSTKSVRKLKLPDNYSNFKDLPFKTGTPLFSPVSTYDMNNKMHEFEENQSAMKQEIEWLEKVRCSNVDNCDSWSQYHSARTSSLFIIPGIHSMLPPIDKKVASVEAQHHCMTIIRDTISVSQSAVKIFTMEQSPTSCKE